MRRPRTRRRGEAERGASAVEFALIVPLFFMLVMGMITGGFALDRKSTLTHAAREAARSGATLPTDGSSGVPNAWFDEIADVAVESSVGSLGVGIPGRYVCVAYVGFRSRHGSTEDWTGKRVESGGTISYATGSVLTPSTWCYEDGRGTDGAERRVQVVVKRDSDLSTVLWSQTLTLTSEAVQRFEAVTPR